MSYLATSFSLTNAVETAMADSSIVSMAQMLTMIRDSVDDQAFMKLMFEYSAHLTAVTGDFVTQVFMTEEQILAMMKEVKELGESALSDE